jgi:hypothetical protein
VNEKRFIQDKSIYSIDKATKTADKIFESLLYIININNFAA